MFITLKWCLLFGAAVCLGVPYHSSEANQQEVTEAGSEDKASQFMLELYHKVGKSEWKDEEMPDNNIEEFKNEGHLFARTKRNFCKRHAMQVNFDTLYGENNAFIAPRSFNAYRCSGECPFPLASHMNTTTHAVIKKLMSEVDRKWPSPCCVPTTLNAMSVLYFDANDVVKYKVMENMIVEGCGCR